MDFSAIRIIFSPWYTVLPLVRGVICQLLSNTFLSGNLSPFLSAPPVSFFTFKLYSRSDLTLYQMRNIFRHLHSWEGLKFRRSWWITPERVPSSTATCISLT